MDWNQRLRSNARLTALDKDGKRLELLHEYTKWHNGIYLTIGGGLTVLATNDQTNWPVTVNRAWAVVALVLMSIAGMSGGVIATTAIEKRDLGHFMESLTGPFRCRALRGRSWTRLEHYAFWSSLLALAIALFEGQQTASYFVTTVPSEDHSRVVGLCSPKPTEAVKYWDTELDRRVLTRSTLLWWKPPTRREKGPSQADCAEACRSPHASYAFVCAQPVDVQARNSP